MALGGFGVAVPIRETGDYQSAARFEHAVDFLERIHVVGHVFEDAVTRDHVE